MRDRFLHYPIKCIPTSLMKTDRSRTPTISRPVTIRGERKEARPPPSPSERRRKGAGFAPWATICGRPTIIVRDGTTATERRERADRGTAIRARRGRSTKFNAKHSVINTLGSLGNRRLRFPAGRCSANTGITDFLKSSSFGRKTAEGKEGAHETICPPSRVRESNGGTQKLSWRARARKRE